MDDDVLTFTVRQYLDNFDFLFPCYKLKKKITVAMIFLCAEQYVVSLATSFVEWRQASNKITMELLRHTNKVI